MLMSGYDHTLILLFVYILNALVSYLNENWLPKCLVM